MNRITAYDAEHNVTIDSKYHAAAVRKLAAYEDMQEALEMQLAEVVARIDRMKEEGKLKGATGNQLLAQKMALGATLRMYEAYGVE